MSDRPLVVYAVLGAVAVAGIMPSQSTTNPAGAAPVAQSIVAAKSAPAPAPNSAQLPTDPDQLIQLWSQGADIEQSLVAIVVGSAEGTRTIDGGKTSLYEGHTDPGNGVWNRGSFSYQFGNEENLSPQEASKRQFAKIKGHMETVKRKAAALKITLTPWEWMNAIDLANQAPLCITEDGGYVERLVEARQKAAEKKWNEYQTVLYARIWSYWDASKGGFDAGGLRAYDDISKEESVRRDQDRRMSMMKKALELAHSKGIAGGLTVNGGESYQPVSYAPTEIQAYAVWLRTQSARGQRR